MFVCFSNVGGWFYAARTQRNACSGDHTACKAPNVYYRLCRRFAEPCRMCRHGGHCFPRGPLPAGPVSTTHSPCYGQSLLDGTEHLRTAVVKGLTEVTFLYLDGLGLWSDF